MGRGPGVRAASKSSLQIDFQYKGVRCRERIGLPPTPANRKYVQRLKATIEYEIATGTFVYAKHFPDSKRARGVIGAGLEKVLLDYCNSLTGELEPETLNEYRRDAKIIAAGLPGKTLASLKRADIREWVSNLKMGKKRIDNLLIPLRGALNRAVEDDQIQASPLHKFRVKRIGKPQETIDPFTPAEVEALAKDELTGAYWQFWAWSGLRAGEIMALQWEDVDADCASVNVWRAIRMGREKTPKTATGNRRITLLRPARDALKRLERSEGVILKHYPRGVPYTDDQELRRTFTRVCEAMKVRYRYPYQLRHTFATWALSSGEIPKWIADYMGHADTLMLFKTYGKWMAGLAPNAGAKMVKAAKSKAA